MASLQIRGGPRRRVFQILDAEFSVGGGADDALRVAGVSAAGLRIVAAGAGHRVTAAEGTELIVNGRPSGPRALLHGDRIRIGGVELVYCEDGRPSPPELPPGAGAGFDLRIDAIPSGVATSARPRPQPAPGPIRRDVDRPAVRRTAGPASRGRPVAERRAPRTPRRSSRAWIFAVVGIVLLAAASLRVLSTRRVERAAADIVMLAESQLAAGHEERALATLSLTRERALEPALRERIEQLQRRARTQITLRADHDELERAAASATPIRRLWASEAEASPLSRPAARELVRLLRAWLATYRDVAARHDAHRPTIDEFEAKLHDALPFAADGEPDQAEDVLFTAARLTRFVPRRYPEAIALLDAWLSSAPPDAAGRAEVERRGAAYVDAAPRYLETERAAIERMVARGELERAIAALRALIEHSGAGSRGDARARLADLEAQRR